MISIHDRICEQRGIHRCGVYLFVQSVKGAAMQLTQIQIRQVQQSFGRAATKRRFITTLFYDRLFELDPSLRPLFHNKNLEEQGCKFMQMMALVISSLNDPVMLKQRLENMGERHLYYGVRQEHYATFGAALLW